MVKKMREWVSDRYLMPIQQLYYWRYDAIMGNGLINCAMMVSWGAGC
jgi:hypothetical protein